MDWIDKEIDAIARDRSHGASQLARSAIEILINLCKRSKEKDPSALASAVRQTALSLAKVRPSMAPIRNWSLVFSHRFQEKIRDRRSFSEVQQQGVILGKELLARQQRFIELQIKAAREILKKRKSVVTLSYSSTVESILRDSLPSSCRVVIAESRPLMEGRRLFKNLEDIFPDLRMITDAQMGLAIPNADLVLVGADTILADLGVVNKTGTYLSALVSHTHGRDFFVAADTYKMNVAVDSRNCVLESKSGSELWPQREKHCDNVYFDITPAQFISGFITEKGILDVAGMKPHVEKWKELYKELDGGQGRPPYGKSVQMDQ
jgi:translation initiation factor 2B subunit (eIF-2B alpha/beta/delta family)